MNFFKTHTALDLIKKFVPENPVIVEAGAFDGRDTLRMAKAWPQAHIHAFEPVPEIFEKLKINTTDFSRIYHYQQALSNQDGTAIFYVSEKPTKPGIAAQAGSLRSPKERLKWSSLIFPYTITVPTIMFETWTTQNTINSVDVLWLDMQGHELDVLKTISAEMLKKINVIYTEVAFIQAYSGQSTYDEVKLWLESHSFKEIGYDFKNRTDWFFGNCLFVQENKF